MKKSNIKYLIFSGLLIIASLCFLISVIFFSSTYIYSFFDITGLGKYIQIMMTLILLIIAIVSIVKSVRAIKYGVDFNFNKHFFIVFAVFIILSIAGFFCVRRVEENVSQKMARDIANIEQSYSDASGPGNALMQSEEKHQAYHKYVDKEKHYIRKSQIATQIKYSPFIIERYRNLLFHNPNYLYYDALGGEEVAYYSVFLKMALVGVVGAAFYGFNFFSKRKKTKEYYANYNNYNNEAEE